MSVMFLKAGSGKARHGAALSELHDAGNDRTGNLAVATTV